MRWWRVIATVAVGVVVLSLGLLLSAVVVARHGRPDGSAPLSEAEIESLAVGAGAATVRVAADSCTGGMTGSGFVAGGRVVTSGHLVSGATELIFDGPGARGRVAVARVLDPADLALSAPLTRPGASLDADLELAPAAPADGSPVVIVGRTGGRLRWLGAVVRTVDGAAYGADGPLLLLDRAVAPGWSGGPVLDRSGRVVGVVRAVEPAAGVTLAEPTARLELRAAEWQQDDIDRVATGSCKSDHPNG